MTSHYHHGAHMNTTTFHIPLDDDLKKRAFAVIERFGLTPTQAVRLFLTQIAETDNVPLALDDQDHSADYEKNPITMQAVQDARDGKVTRYASFDDFMAELHEEH